MNHLQLLENAKIALDKLFSDTSVDRETTKVSLEELRDEVDTKIASLSDI